MVLDLKGVLETPSKFKWRSVPGALQVRELGTPPRNVRELGGFSPGFTPDIIQSLERSFSFRHGGCVNTAAFNEDGTLLVTGSDDVKLKIWKSSNFVAPESVKAKHTIITGHSSNIFHALFSPGSNNVVVSCAADGEIRVHDLSNQGAERMLATFTGMANMFVFQDAHTLLATNFRRNFTGMGGSVVGIDVRSNTGSFVLLDSADAQVKALALCPWDPWTLAVGVGEQVWFCDIRMHSDSETLQSSSSPPCLLERLTLSGVHSLESQCRKAVGTFLPYHGREPDFHGSQLSRTYGTLTKRKLSRHEEISISSIEFSRLSKEYLVSFQGDGIYRFKCSPTGAFGEGCLQSAPVQLFTGHVNEMTFLKKASYFGPNEEYVCCGGDDGNVFIYLSETGDIISCKKGDGFQSRRGTGEGIVNGVVPHPFANSLVSYGLDNDAKLWTVPLAREDLDEEMDSRNSNRHSPKRVITKEDDAAERDEKRTRLCGNTNEALKKTQVTLLQPGMAPFSMMSTLVRCCRMRENIVHRLGELTEPIPSSSLVLAAVDDGEDALLAELARDSYTPTRFEYCFRKTEEVRERGNVAFHDGKFREALELYSTAVQYCLGAHFLRTEMLEVFHTTDPNKQKLLEELLKITERSEFEIDFPSSNFTKRQQEPASEDDLRRIVEVYKQIWNLFLVCNLNAAQAALKLKTYKFALSFADQAIEIDPTSAKAGFRKASALKGLGRLGEALREFKRVRTLPDGDSQLVRNCIRELTQRTGKPRGKDDMDDAD